jgi:hypothetical protein
MRSSRSHRTIVLSGAALVAGFLPVMTASAATPGSIGGAGELRGVYCTSAGNCLAVGDFVVHGADVNQMLHWNGKKWSKEAVPSAGGTKSADFSELFAVRCTSPANCLAVGEYGHSGAQLNQILYWNGKKWAVAAAVPQPGGKASGGFSELSDVACTSARSCWAGGQYGHQGAMGEVILNQALHWNGKRWSRVTTPDPAGTAANDENSIKGIRCTSASDCWAVGAYGTGAGTPVLLNEVLHWNGKKWSEVTVPDPGGTATMDVNLLQSVSCTSATSCEAAGSYGSNLAAGVRLNQVLRWNGAKWSLSHPPDPDGTAAGAAQNLTGISCISSSSCFAVGHSGSQNESTGVLNEAFRWNGRKWTQLTTPDPGGTAMHDLSQLLSVRCVTSADCWAVGNQVDGGGAFYDMILHWNGATWSVR